MDDAILLDGAELTDAMRIWAGWGTCRVPCREDARIEALFETAEAEALLAIIGRLEEDFYASDAYRTAPNLESMVERATADFRRLHPDVSDEIVRVLAWCYTHDSR
jgi:hypothetical protein